MTHTQTNGDGTHERVILITGTTGGLGAQLLEYILKTHSPTPRIFALNRIGSDQTVTALQRQESAFSSRGLDLNLLKHSKLTLLSANTLDQLPSEIKEELSTTLTHIIHLAYPVNFNLTLASFEPSIQFTQSLLELANQVSIHRPNQKPNFIFASSVATLASFVGENGEWVKEDKVDMKSCLGTGYGESKRVCEEIIEAYVKAYGFTAVILRIGQMCGSRRGGSWNMTEWFPLIVQSAITLHCLPDGADDIAWIPVDEAAVVISELSFHPRHSTPEEQYVYRHVIHPRAAKWHDLILPISQWISENCKPIEPIELVPYEQWVQKLNKQIEDGTPENLGAAKLLDFYSNQSPQFGLHTSVVEGYEAMGVTRLITKDSEVESQRLKDLTPLNQDDAIGWLTFWKKMGHFNH